MKYEKNICKFITSISDDKIIISNFVLETNPESIDFSKSGKHNAVHLVTKGKGIYENSVFSREIQTGDIFFSFEGIDKKIINTENLNYIYISFNGARSAELYTRFGITPSNCIFKGHEGLISFWQNAILKASEKNLDLISEAVLLYTFGEMSESSPNESGYLLGEITKYIDENFTDNEFNLESLSKKLGYSSKYISRTFKKNMGITFSSYLTSVRIKHAVFLMEQGVTAIKNVALLSGYKDPLYFSAVFKNTIGVSPKEYTLKNK